MCYSFAGGAEGAEAMHCMLLCSLKVLEMLPEVIRCVRTTLFVGGAEVRRRQRLPEMIRVLLCMLEVLGC